MNNIMLKARGVKELNRSQVIDIQPFLATDTYTPISNKELIETALENLELNGFRVKEEFYKVDGSLQKMVGGIRIYSQDSEMEMMLGLKNSGDKSMSAAYALGVNILICSNSAVRGEEMMIRKHTGEANIIMRNAMSEGIKRLHDNFLATQKDFSRLKEIELTKKTVASLIGQLYLNEEIVKSHQLSLLKKEISTESYNYGVKGSAYNLYQAVTHSLKDSHPMNYISDHANLHRFFEQEFELTEELELV